MLKMIWVLSLLSAGIYYALSNDFGTTNFALGWILITCGGIVMREEE